MISSRKKLRHEIYHEKVGTRRTLRDVFEGFLAEGFGSFKESNIQIPQEKDWLVVSTHFKHT